MADVKKNVLVHHSTEKMFHLVDRIEDCARTGDFEGAAEAIKRDFQPIDDWRGTASYRVTVAANLIRRLKLRIDGTPSIDLESL